MHEIIKKMISEHDVHIYGLYIQRMIKEHDHIWGRFKIYFAFNTGVFIAMGFFLAPIFNTGIFSHLSVIYWSVLIILSVLGVIFSQKWRESNVDSKRWMFLMNKNLMGIEEVIFTNKKEYALFYKIDREYEDGLKTVPQKKDVIDINIEVSGVFKKVFIFLLVSSTVLWLLAIILPYVT